MKISSFLSFIVTSILFASTRGLATPFPDTEIPADSFRHIYFDCLSPIPLKDFVTLTLLGYPENAVDWTRLNLPDLPNKQKLKIELITENNLSSRILAVAQKGKKEFAHELTILSPTYMSLLKMIAEFKGENWPSEMDQAKALYSTYYTGILSDRRQNSNSSPFSNLVKPGAFFFLESRFGAILASDFSTITLCQASDYGSNEKRDLAAFLYRFVHDPNLPAVFSCEIVLNN